MDSSASMRRIQPSRFSQGNISNTSLFESLEVTPSDGSKSPQMTDEGLNTCSSPTTTSSASSIGKNSDDSGTLSDGEDQDEAQSSYKGPLNMMLSLEEVLPVRKGISKFYNGKSKSFTSLIDSTSTSCIKEIAKPENAYTRKRRNTLVKTMSASRSSLALAAAATTTSSGMSSSESNSSCSEEPSSRSPPVRPPLHPQSKGSQNNLALSSSLLVYNCSSLRSYSVADLQQCAFAMNSNKSRTFPDKFHPNNLTNT